MANPPVLSLFHLSPASLSHKTFLTDNWWDNIVRGGGRDGRGRGAGLNKVIIFIIRDDGKFHASRNLFLLIDKKGYVWHNNFLSQKQVTVTEKLSVTETNICCNKKVFVTGTSLCLTKIYVFFPSEKSFPLQKQVVVRVYIWKKHFCHRKKFLSQINKFFGEKFLSRKNASITEASW